LAYTIKLLEDTRHRYIAYATLHGIGDAESRSDIRTLVDTGAFNTMIDTDFAKQFGTMLPLYIPVVIGGHSGMTQGCILNKVTLGDFNMTRVFALTFPFTDWLTRHIVLGTNVLNNWDFTPSRTDDKITFIERIPHDAPNKVHPYQNYFRNGEYVAVQDELPTPVLPNS
jgi:hypothetical protein